jgi:quinol monooxygenase YgiN
MPPSKVEPTARHDYPSRMHIIAAEVVAAAGKREDLLQLCRSMLAPSRAEAGCISYRFFEDPDCPGHVLFFEEWKDMAAIDFHFATPHFTDFSAEIPGLIEGEPKVAIYEAAPVQA